MYASLMMYSLLMRGFIFVVLHRPTVFTARCYASAVLAMALCLSVRLSVCLSVRPSQVGVLLKRLNVGSHKQHHTIAQGV